MSTLKPPLAASDLPESWHLAIRQALASGTPIRANPGRPCIDVWSETRGWMQLLLPSGSVEFTSAAERDLVLKQIQEAK